MSLFRNRRPVTEVEPVDLVVPRATIDGWSLEGTALATKVPRGEQRELSTLLHGIAVRVETPWTYLRAVEILEGCGEEEQAYAVCEAWLKVPASRRDEHASDTRQLTRLRDRLRSRLAARSTAS
jgi:hypothetical protein